MRNQRLLILLMLLSITVVACDNSDTDMNTLEVTGLLQELQVSAFQYGTHTITNNNEFYALRSNTIDLDNFLNQEVTIIGTKISGYPVDGGPEYLEVMEVR